MPSSTRAPGSAAVLVTALLLVLAGACANRPPAAPGPTSASSPTSAPGSVPPPTLRVETVTSGLDHPWDVAFLGPDRMLVTQRGGALSLVRTAGGPVTPVAVRETGATAPPPGPVDPDVYARGEAGLMGVAAFPDAATSGAFVTCEAHQTQGTPDDVRLVVWRLAPDGTSAQKVRDPLVGGLPLNPSGRHSGCRPTFAPDGSLLVGTGDTARATIAQDRASLGGKVLRIDPLTGGPAAGNPFASSGSAAERLVSGYGHRNVQAVAIQPGTGRAWSVEHGPDVDDEVNVVVPGANYGWDPARGGETPGRYDESVPMTDLAHHPDAVRAAWSSGPSTVAPSGADFLAGPSWGDLAGSLAVATLAGQRMLLMRPDGTGIGTVTTPAALDHTHGRLRGARLGPDGALYVTTDNGRADEILRVTRG